MLQPPPRKVKPTALLKDVQAEQVTRLQAREQQLLDILEDIRQFSKQRSDMERQYGQSLLKLTNQMLSKKELFQLPDIRAENGPQKRTVNSAWKKVLEETEKLAWQRVKAAEIYASHVAEPSRSLKESMAAVVKKAMEQLSSLHKDLAQTALEMTIAQKTFADDESAAMAARLKAADAEMRYKKRQVSLLTSQGTLQRNTAKTLARREMCNARAVHTRNTYLMELAAANAHTARLHDVDLPDLYMMLDEGMYEKMSDFLSTIGKTEVDVCSAILQGYKSIAEFANMVDRDYNLQCFISDNEVFEIPIHFEYESVIGGEPVRKLSTDYQEQHFLVSEACKWATKEASESQHIQALRKAASRLAIGDSRSLGRSIVSVNSAGKDIKKMSSNADEADPETALENLCCSIRKAEAGKVKAEARLSLLKAANINIEAALEQARADRVTTSTEQDAVSQLSENGGDRWPAVDDDNASFDSLSDFDDDSPRQSPSSTCASDLLAHYPYNVTALYTYQASNADELSLAQGEVLEVVHPGDGDGWLKARNGQGHTGLVPNNYIEVLHDAGDLNVGDDSAIANRLDSAVGSDADMAAGSGLQRPSEVASLKSVSIYSATDYEVQQAMLPKDSGVKADGVWLRALYDYAASCDEELSFCEGQFIRLISKVGGGVDDGYWQGQISNQVGVFPSLVVDELSQFEYPTIEQASNWQLAATGGDVSALASGPRHNTANGRAGEPAVVGSVHTGHAPMMRSRSTGESQLFQGRSRDMSSMQQRRPSGLELSHSLPNGSGDALSPGGGGDGADNSPNRPTPKQRSLSIVADRRSQVEAQLTAQFATVAAVTASGQAAFTPMRVAASDRDTDASRRPVIAPRPTSTSQPSPASSEPPLTLQQHARTVNASTVQSLSNPAPSSNQATLAAILQSGLGREEAARGVTGSRPTDDGRSAAAAASRASTGNSREHESAKMAGHWQGAEVRAQRIANAASTARPVSMVASTPSFEQSTPGDRRASAPSSENKRNHLLHQSATTDNLYNPSYRNAVHLDGRTLFESRDAQVSIGSHRSSHPTAGQTKSQPTEGVLRRQQFSTPQPIRRSRQASASARKESAV